MATLTNPFHLNRVALAAAMVGEKAYLRRRKVATVAVGLLAIFLGYHVIFGQNGLTAFRQKRADARTLDTQLVELTHENERLRAHVDRLKSDPGAIEHEAREALHYTRPGEVIYTLPAGPSNK
jgi:cell division protein FtsB